MEELNQKQLKSNRTSKTELIKWVNGNPVPVYSPPVDDHNIKAVARAALSLEYKPKTIIEDSNEVIDPKEKDYEGCTNLEVIFMKAGQKAAEGDLDSASFVLDRVLGKPKQHSESVIINTTLQEALHNIADQMEADDAVEVTEIINASTPPSVLD